MKIGIGFAPFGRSYGRYGDEKFTKLKEHGYGAADYNIDDTAPPLYALNEDELTVQMGVLRRKASACTTASKH